MVKSLIDARNKLLSKALVAYTADSYRYRQIARGSFWLLFTTSCVLLLIELPPSQHGWPYWDKVQHLTLFTVLGILAQAAYPAKSWRIVVGLTSYGLLIEWLQGILTVTRIPNLQDWFADIIGVLLGLLLTYGLGQLKRSGQQHVI